MEGLVSGLAELVSGYEQEKKEAERSRCSGYEQDRSLLSVREESRDGIEVTARGHVMEL